MKRNILLALLICFFAANIVAQNTSKVKISFAPCKFQDVEVEYSINNLQEPGVTQKTLDRELIVPTNSYLHIKLNVPDKYEQQPLNGVSTLDMVYILKQILGQEVFTTPAQLMAADVNNNGAITVADFVEIRKLILGITDKFSNSPSWRFIFPSEGLIKTPNFVSFWIDKDKEIMIRPVKIGDINSNSSCK